MRTFLMTTLSLTLLIASAALAQNFELDTVSYKPAMPAQPAPAIDPDQPTVATPTSAAGLFPEMGGNGAIAKTSGTRAPGQKEQKPGAIQLKLDDVEIMTPPAGLAVCFATLTAVNETESTLQALTANVTFGGVNLPVSYSGIAPGASQPQNLATMGPACQTMLGTPALDIKTCIIPGMDLESCKSQIKLVPALANVAN